MSVACSAPQCSSPLSLRAVVIEGWRSESLEEHALIDVSRSRQGVCEICILHVSAEQWSVEPLVYLVHTGITSCVVSLSIAQMDHRGQYGY